MFKNPISNNSDWYTDLRNQTARKQLIAILEKANLACKENIATVNSKLYLILDDVTPPLQRLADHNALSQELFDKTINNHVYQKTNYKDALKVIDHYVGTTFGPEHIKYVNWIFDSYSTLEDCFFFLKIICMNYQLDKTSINILDLLDKLYCDENYRSVCSNILNTITEKQLPISETVINRLAEKSVVQFVEIYDQLLKSTSDEAASLVDHFNGYQVKAAVCG